MTRPLRVKQALASVIVVGLGLAGCTSAKEAQSQSAKSAVSQGGTKTIGLITFSGTDPSANIVISSAKKKAQELGYEVVVVDAQGQVDQANTAMQNLVQRKVAGIAITVFPVSSLAAGLASTKQAGIPVVTSGGGTGDGVAVNVDDSQGEKVTQALIDDNKGEGGVLTLTYLGGRPCQLRLASFNDTVKAKAPNLKVDRQAVTVPGQVESATSATLAWLAAHPAGSAPNLSIYACFDDPALGAIAALKQTKRSDVKVYSFNGIAPALAAVKDGTMTGTLWFDQNAVGSTLVQVMDKSIKAGNVSTSEQVPAPSVLVTKANYDSFVAEHPDAIKVG
jgi:ribose transport system substrate-binding protein